MGILTILLRFYYVIVKVKLFMFYDSTAFDLKALLLRGNWALDSAMEKIGGIPQFPQSPTILKYPNRKGLF